VYPKKVRGKTQASKMQDVHQERQRGNNHKKPPNPQAKVGGFFFFSQQEPVYLKHGWSWRGADSVGAAGGNTRFEQHLALLDPRALHVVLLQPPAVLALSP
jgi:hypothetical protein